MKKNIENDRNEEELLKAENAVLRLKLETEFGMKYTEMGQLTPKLENEWLNSVYRFEQEWKNPITYNLFEHLGRPALRPVCELGQAEVSRELRRVRSLMQSKFVELDHQSGYDDALIYKFITEELMFEDMWLKPSQQMTFHFIYEEYHPQRQS